jgi:hypothetical protein
MSSSSSPCTLDVESAQRRVTSCTHVRAHAHTLTRLRTTIVHVSLRRRGRRAKQQLLVGRVKVLRLCVENQSNHNVNTRPPPPTHLWSRSKEVIASAAQQVVAKVDEREHANLQSSRASMIVRLVAYLLRNRQRWSKMNQIGAGYQFAFRVVNLQFARNLVRLIELRRHMKQAHTKKTVASTLRNRTMFFLVNFCCHSDSMR